MTEPQSPAESRWIPRNTLFFIALIALGLFGSRWSGARLWHELPVGALLVLTVVPYLAWPFTLDITTVLRGTL